MQRIAVGLVVTMMLLSAAARSAETASDSSRPSGVALSEILETAAKRLNKRFIVDPRVRADVTVVGFDPNRVTYAQLQSILEVHGFVATAETNGIVRIVPDSGARQLPMPVIVEPSGDFAADDVVTRLIDVGPLNAAELIPILRPLLPQPAHLVAHPQTNTLIVAASYANTKKIEDIVRAIARRPVRASTPVEPARAN